MKQLAEAIRQARRIALCAHVSPDGDTIGSALALRLALLRMGKQVDFYCADPVPETLLPLPGAETCRSAEDADGQTYDLVLPVDVASRERMGACQRLLAQGSCTGLIDHHGTNGGFCRINVVDGDAPAAALPVWRLLRELEAGLTPDMALCLYVAVSTDTGNFSYDNMTPEAFELAAELLRCGLPLGKWSRRLFRERPLPQARLIGRALGGIRVLLNGKITLQTLTRSDLSACGAKDEHTENLVNLGLDITGVRMAAMIREAAGGTLRVSLRAVAPYRVDGIAASFGGGGHAQAAGCTFENTTMEAAAEQLSAALEAALLEQERNE